MIWIRFDLYTLAADTVVPNRGVAAHTGTAGSYLGGRQISHFYEH